MYERNERQTETTTLHASFEPNKTSLKGKKAIERKFKAFRWKENEMMVKGASNECSTLSFSARCLFTNLNGFDFSFPKQKSFAAERREFLKRNRIRVATFI